MSITASYRRLSPEVFQRILADRALTETYSGSDFAEDAATYDDCLEVSGCFMDIGKFWDGLHCLLTGSSAREEEPFPAPLGNVVQGGTPTEWEADYGTVRCLMPEEVQDVATALEGINVAALRQRYNPKDFLVADIYPGGEVWEEAGIEELLEVFGQVRGFFSVAAREGEVVLLSSDQTMPPWTYGSDYWDTRTAEQLYLHNLEFQRIRNGWY